MARFTDPAKWKEPWFRNLTAPQKLLWLYIVDECDNAGFFYYDPELFSLFTGMKQKDVETAFEGLASSLQGAKSGNEYYIKTFFKFGHFK
jgi:hypothetical protein